MKKLMGILLAASMVFSLAACGSTADTAASSAAGTTATAEGSSNNQAPDVKVGAIILGDETEGYSAAHINGIKEAAAELGMSDDQIVWKYKIAEGGVTADAAEDLVGQRCNLIISNSRSATSAPTTTPRSSPATPPSSWASRAFTPMSRWRSCTRTPGSTSTRRALPPRP